MQQGRPRRCSWGPLGAVLLFIVCALGCMAAKSYSPEYGGSSGGGYGYQDYGEGQADKDAEYRVEEERYKQKREAPARDASVTSPEESEMPSDGTGTEAPPSPTPAPEEGPPSHGRQIIYTAGMGLSVFDVEDVMSKLEAIPEQHGGWLHQRYDNSVVLRVPAAKLSLIIEEVASWGVVEWKTLSALDVTAEYTDLDSRIRVLEQMQKHLQELLARAQNVEQALEIQVELSRINAELEQLRAQMRMLESSIAFSTLAVQLRERSTVVAEPSDDPFPWVDQLGAEATAYR
ncbi:MAG TPA: DUF4349 domain-containing protein [Enhygromyxa sp.]|nr:DUF4349 domain-containing protein [Enhygromyxa sp.]